MIRIQHLGLLLIGFWAITSWSCQPKKNAETAETETAAPNMPSYPALGNEEVSRIYSQSDHVDIIFYNLPISVSQDDPASVKNTALYVSPASPIITSQCKPIARLSWMAQGTIIREADVHVEAGCQYLLFFENSKPVAANAMQQAGVDFFQNIIRQVEQQKQGLQPK
jgi:hypothetical protein